MNTCKGQICRNRMSWMWAGLFVAAIMTQVCAGESLANVPLPMVEGETVIPADAPDENPTMLNLRVQNIEFHPYAGASLGYDSNIYLTDKGQTDDPFLQVSPGLLIRTDPAGADRFMMDWNTNLQARFFVNESQANTVQISSYLNSKFMTEPWDFTLKVGGGRFEDPINATFADRTPRAVAEGLIRATSKFLDRLSFEGGYHGTYIDYHTTRFATLDRTENAVPLRAIYRLSDAAIVYLNTTWQLVEFRNPGLNNFYSIDTRVGFTGEFMDGKVFSMDINAGVLVARIKNDNGLNPSVRAAHVVFDSYFRYAPTEQASIGLALYATPRVNLALTQPLRPVYGARLDLGYKLMENKLALTASGFYERIDNLPMDSDQVFLSGSLRARYSFKPYAFGYVSYQLQSRQADGTLQDYVDNKVMVGGGITL